MPLHLDEEDAEFFSAALSLLDDLPDAPPPPSFPLPPSASMPPDGPGDGREALDALDAVELEGLAALCLPAHGADGATATASAWAAEAARGVGVNVGVGVDVGDAFALALAAAPSTEAGEKKQGEEARRPAAARGPRRPRAREKGKPPSGDKSKPKAHLPYNPNKARDERKLELIYLRKKVTEMEAQLEALQQAPAPGARPQPPVLPRPRQRLLGAGRELDAPPVSALCVSALGSARAPSALAWKDLCLRQLQRRVKAERENTRLKRELEGQLKVAKSMEKLLNRPSGSSSGGGDGCGQPPKRARSVHVPPTDPMADAAIFEELLAGAEAAYHDVDAVLADMGLSAAETARRGARVREGERGLFLDIFGTSLLPFDMGSTGAAVWEYFKGLRKHRGPLYHKTMRSLEPSEDTIIENFALELVANHTRADFRIRQVVKRFVEEHRVLVVWTAHVEPIAVANELFSGLGFREKAYVVCRRPPASSADADADADADTLTLLQRGLRVTPHAVVKHEAAADNAAPSPDARGLDRATVGALTEFVLSLCAADMAADQELIENVLVDQAIHQHAAAAAAHP